MKKNIKTSAGFTLIEIMISLMLLIVISAMMSDVFSGSSNAVTNANRRSDSGLQARVALDLIARELEGALISTNLQMASLAGGEDVRFFSTASSLHANQSASTSVRSFMPVRYYADGSNTLYRWYESPTDLSSIASYYIGKDWTDASPPTAGKSSDVLLDYVTQFKVLVNGQGDTDRYEYVPGSTNVVTAPVYADVIIGVLGDKDVETARQLKLSFSDPFVRERERLYTTRVYFRNRPIDN